MCKIAQSPKNIWETDEDPDPPRGYPRSRKPAARPSKSATARSRPLRSIRPSRVSRPSSRVTASRVPLMWLASSACVAKLVIDSADPPIADQTETRIAEQTSTAIGPDRRFASMQNVGRSRAYRVLVRTPFLVRQQRVGRPSVTAPAQLVGHDHGSDDAWRPAGTQALWFAPSMAASRVQGKTGSFAIRASNSASPSLVLTVVSDCTRSP